MKPFDFLENIHYECIENKLSQQEVEIFEKTNNIILPEDYKFFLTHIGNGIRIILSDDKERIIKGIKRTKLKKHNPLLSQEFIFNKPFLHSENPKPNEWFEDCDDEEYCIKCKHFKKCPFAFDETLYNDELPYYSGVLPICYAGCTYQYCLILNGNHKGEVWMDNELSDFVPSKQSFTEFIKWLSTAECY